MNVGTRGEVLARELRKRARRGRRCFGRGPLRRRQRQRRRSRDRSGEECRCGIGGGQDCASDGKLRLVVAGVRSSMVGDSRTWRLRATANLREREKLDREPTLQTAGAQAAERRNEWSPGCQRRLHPGPHDKEAVDAGDAWAFGLSGGPPGVRGNLLFPCRAWGFRARIPPLWGRRYSGVLGHGARSGFHRAGASVRW